MIIIILIGLLLIALRVSVPLWQNVLLVLISHNNQTLLDALNVLMY